MQFWFYHFLNLCSSLLRHSPNCKSAIRLQKEMPPFIKKQSFILKIMPQLMFLEKEKHIWTATMYKIVCSFFEQSSLSKWLFEFDAIKTLVVVYCHLKTYTILFIYHLYVLVISLAIIFLFYCVGLRITVFKHWARPDSPLEMCFTLLVLYQFILHDLCFVQFSMIYVWQSD